MSSRNDEHWTFCTKNGPHKNKACIFIHCSCGVVEDVYNTGKGYAFITMADSESAEKAIAELNGITIDGQEIKVDTAKAPREGGGGGCSGAGGDASDAVDSASIPDADAVSINRDTNNVSNFGIPRRSPKLSLLRRRRRSSV